MRIALVAFDWQPAFEPVPSCSFSSSYSTAAKLAWARGAQQPQRQGKTACATAPSCGSASHLSPAVPAHLAQLTTAWVAEPASRPPGQLTGSLVVRPTFETVFTAQGSVWGSHVATAVDATPKQLQAWVSVPGASAALPLLTAIEPGPTG